MKRNNSINLLKRIKPHGEKERQNCYRTDTSRHKKPSELIIDRELLDNHFDSIKSGLLNIYTFTEQKITKNPTHIHWKPIDIELAWDDSKAFFALAYAELCSVSRQLHVLPLALDPYFNFKESLMVFIDLINTIELHIDSSEETKQHTNAQLQTIDGQILLIQQATNRLEKYVMVDFEYPRRKL